MTLLDWMRLNSMSDAEMASRVGNCSAHAVRKWKYGERCPPPERIVRIEAVTEGKVTLRDFVEVAA